MNLTKLGFTKIAEKKKKDYDVGTGFKHMVAGDLVGSAVATVGATPFIKKDILPEFLRSPLEKDKRDSKTKMENRNLSKGLIKRIKKSKINYLDTPHTASGAYNPATNTIIAPKAKPAIIAHEFGHAKSFRKSKSLAPIYLTSKFAPAAGTLAATIQDPDSTLAKATPAIVAAGSVPMIAEEHRA
jgi:hypothetical protein